MSWDSKWVVEAMVVIQLMPMFGCCRMGSFCGINLKRTYFPVSCDRITSHAAIF